jgi:hypothetical protein
VKIEQLQGFVKAGRKAVLRFLPVDGASGIGYQSALLVVD